jgi:hypothetical protein
MRKRSIISSIRGRRQAALPVRALRLLTLGLIGP